MSTNLNDIINSSQYFNDLIQAFPDLREKVENEDGVHSKMECFADYTIEQIKKVDLNELKKCFEFQDVKIPICPELENAMTVSYCESLLLGEVGGIMEDFLKYMKPKLLKMYLDYANYYYGLIDGKDRDN